MIEVELPDGRVVEIDTTDQTVAAQAAQKFLASGAPKQEPGMLEDAAKSTGAGLANATAGLLGGAGDLRSLASAGVSALGDQLGAAPDKVQAFKDMVSRAAKFTGAGQVLANAPTTQQVLATATDPIVSPDYKPQTGLGEYLKTGAEFAPGLLVGGEGGLARQLLTNVAAPAIASETLGQLTQGTGAEPWARAAGGLAGGLGAASVAERFNQAALARQAQRAIPSGEDILKAGSRGFEAVKASDAVFNPRSIEQMSKDIRTGLLNEGSHPTLGNQSGIFNTLDRLEAMGASGGGVTPKDLEVIRKNLVAEKTSLDGGTRNAAKQATDSFMSRYSNFGPEDILGGSNPIPTLKDAIANYAAGKRSQTLQGKMNLAELNSGSPVGELDSGALGQSLQRTMKQLARPANNTNVPVAKKLGFNEQEVAAIKDAAMGNKLTDAAELMDRVIPAKLGAIPSMIARQIGGLSTKKQVSALDSLVRSNSPLAREVAAQLPQVAAQLPSRTRVLLSGIVPTIVPTVSSSQNR